MANTVQPVRQRDLFNNPISEDQANGVGIGSAAAGPLARPVAGAGQSLVQGVTRGVGQGLFILSH